MPRVRTFPKMDGLRHENENGPSGELAAFLQQEREAILRAWEAQVRELPAAKALGSDELRDHLPDLFERIVELAGERRDGVGPEPDLHALQRLDQGYDLELVASEYSMLREVVLHRWEESSADGSLRLFHAVIDQAVGAAVARFTETRQRILVALDRISAAALELRDPATFLQQIVDVLEELLPSVDAMAIQLLERDGRLHLGASCGPKLRPVVDADAGFPGAIARKRAPVEAGGEELAGGARTAYGVPMFRESELIGVAWISSRTATAFAREDKLLFRAAVERATSGLVQHRLLREAQEERRRLEATLELLPVGVVVADPEGRLRIANRGFRRIWGDGVPLGIGSEGYDAFRARRVEDGTPLAAGDWALARALEKRVTTLDQEVEIESFGGEKRTILNAAAPIVGDDGTLLGAVATNVDITERRRAERARAFLGEAMAILSESLDAARTLRRVAELAVPRLADWCAIDLVVGEGQLQRVAAVHRDPVGQRVLHKLMLEMPARASDFPALQVLESGESLLIPEVTPTMIARVARNDEQWRLLAELGVGALIAAPLVVHGKRLGTITLVASRDRSFTGDDQRLAEELAARTALAVENARLYEDAREAIQARDEMWAVASHELRNPLSALQLQLHAASRQLAKDPEIRGAQLRPRIDSAERQVKRLIDLTSDLLDSSRAQAGRLEMRMQPTELVQLVRSAVEKQAEVALAAGVEVAFEAEGPIYGTWDPSRIEQVITNLITNALKYGRRSPVRIAAREEGEWARLEVRDEGIGIAADELPRLFRPFERTRAGQGKQGTGLGLYIVRRIVEAHAGTISVQSVPEVGTTFVVELPRFSPVASG